MKVAQLTLKVTKHNTCQAPKQQGKLRISPDPCNGFGCNHVGVMELKESPKAHLKSYAVKEGGWLFDMSCCYDSCKKKGGQM